MQLIHALGINTANQIDGSKGSNSSFSESPMQRLWPALRSNRWEGFVLADESYLTILLDFSISHLSFTVPGSTSCAQTLRPQQGVFWSSESHPLSTQLSPTRPAVSLLVDWRRSPRFAHAEASAPS
jgi:hypothetical protein